MPIADSGAVEPWSADTTIGEPSSRTPFHRSPGTPMFAAHASSVLLVTVRMNICVSSTHGATMPAIPKPNTKYASSNVIATCCDALGTAMTYACVGPVVRWTPAGGPSAVHALLNSAELPMSGSRPAGGVHASVGELGTQFGSSAIDGMYCMFAVIVAEW